MALAVFREIGCVSSFLLLLLDSYAQQGVSNFLKYSCGLGQEVSVYNNVSSIRSCFNGSKGFPACVVPSCSSSLLSTASPLKQEK